MDFGGRFVKGFIRQGVQFQPPMPFTLSPKGNSSYSKVELPPIMLVPFVWDMEDVYGTSKGPH